MLYRAARQMTFGIALTIIATVTGCSNPLGPEDVAGAFAMKSIGPIVDFNDGGVPHLVADTLFLEANGFGVRRSTLWRSPSPAGPIIVDLRTDGFSYRVERTRVGFRWSCSPGIACTPNAAWEWYDLGFGARTMQARDALRATYVRLAP